MTPNIINFQTIINQAKWIARSLPDLSRNFKFKEEMYIYLNNTNTWRRTTQEIHTNLPNQNQPYDFENSVYNSITSNFNPNDYDNSIFFGFEYEDCIYDYTVYCEDCETVDTSLQHVILVEWSENEQDTFLGYFWNTNSNAIDSLYIDIDNLDDYYFWVVGIIDHCEKPNRRFGNIEKCNNNGVCEPWIGETPSNCIDCSNKQRIGNKTLYLHSLTPINDIKDRRSSATGASKKYQEAHFSGNYEVAFDYFIYKSNIDRVDSSYWFSRCLPNNFENATGISVSKNSSQDVNFGASGVGLDIFSATGKNCEILRTLIKKNGSSKQNKGPQNPVSIVYNNIMSLDFNELTDIIEFALYEFDRGPASYGNYSFNHDHHVSTFCPAPFDIRIPKFRMKSNKTFYTQTSGSGAGTTTLSSNSLWTNNGLTINGKPAKEITLTLDGEMSITFAITDN